MKARFLRSWHGKLDPAELERFEAELGTKLPLDYRELLLRENGGFATPKGDTFSEMLFYGIYDGPSDLRGYWYENESAQEAGWLPIGEDLNEDPLFLRLSDGKVVLEDEIVADSIMAFLEAHFELQPMELSNRALIVDDLQDALIARLDAGLSPFAEIELETKRVPLVHFAIMLGKIEIVRILLERGADVSGCLHVMLEYKSCHLQLIKLLLRHGADIQEKDENGMRVIDIPSPWMEDILREAEALED